MNNNIDTLLKKIDLLNKQKAKNISLLLTKYRIAINKLILNAFNIKLHKNIEIKNNFNILISGTVIDISEETGIVTISKNNAITTFQCIDLLHTDLTVTYTK